MNRIYVSDLATVNLTDLGKRYVKMMNDNINLLNSYDSGSTDLFPIFPSRALTMPLDELISIFSEKNLFLFGNPFEKETIFIRKGENSIWIKTTSSIYISLTLAGEELFSHSINKTNIKKGIISMKVYQFFVIFGPLIKQTKEKLFKELIVADY